MSVILTSSRSGSGSVVCAGLDDEALQLEQYRRRVAFRFRIAHVGKFLRLDKDDGDARSGFSRRRRRIAAAATGEQEEAAAYGDTLTMSRFAARSSASRQK